MTSMPLKFFSLINYSPRLNRLFLMKIVFPVLLDIWTPSCLNIIRKTKLLVLLTITYFNTNLMARLVDVKTVILNF